MKTLTVLLFTVIILFSSCGWEAAYFVPEDPFVVHEITIKGDKICKYYSNQQHIYCLICANDGLLIDSCGKFQIGDTIKLTK